MLAARRQLLVLITAALLGAATAAPAATYYIGAFAGSTPLDDADCGTGKGTHPSAHPCATLQYWNQSRRQALTAGDVVRFAPGTYKGSVNSVYNCVVAQSGVTYEGRSAGDAGIADFSSVVIDAGNNDPARWNLPCGGHSLVPLGYSGNYPNPEVATISNFTIRDLTLANAPLVSPDLRGGAELYGGPGTSGLVVDHVRVTGNASGGMIIGIYNWRHSQCSGGSTPGSFCSASTPCPGGGVCTSGFDGDCSFTKRNTAGVTVTNSQFDDNARDSTAGAPGGLVIGCAENVDVSKVQIFDNPRTNFISARNDQCTAAGVPAKCCTGNGSGSCTSPNASCAAAGAPDACCTGAGAGTCTDCFTYPDSQRCDNVDGVKFHGCKNTTFTDSEIHDNGEGDIEFGTSYTYQTDGVTLDRVYFHRDSATFPRNPFNSHYNKASGMKPVGGRNITVRNSYGVGDYFYVIEQYNCGQNVWLYNNTFWKTGGIGYVMIEETGYDGYRFVNNIFRSDTAPSTGWSVIKLSPLSTQPTALWQNNVVVSADPSATALWNSGPTSCPEQCGPGIAAGAYGACPTPKTTSGPNPLDDTAAGVASLQSRGALGEWFGPGSGAGDRWGTAPLVVNAAGVDPASLELLSGDSVARGAGQNLWSSQFATDYFGHSRPSSGPWDIGAHQFATSVAPPVPFLQSVTPLGP